MKDKVNYVEIDELLEFGEGEDLVDTLLAQYDKLISREIAAVFKKYFPYSTIDEEKVLKLSRMLIADEKGGVTAESAIKAVQEAAHELKDTPPDDLLGIGSTMQF